MSGTIEGWGFTGSSRKAHYFRDGRSLCRKWGFRSPHAPHEPDTGPSRDDCAPCRRALDAERAAAAAVAPQEEEDE